jgi:multisubunit Na+/H+ antiporter MnhB subunit
MIKQVVAYLVCALGLILLLATFGPVKKLIPIPVPVSATATFLTAAGIILLGIGLAVLFKTGDSNKQPAEVPIYHGTTRKVVGYRRLGK